MRRLAQRVNSRLYGIDGKGRLMPGKYPKNTLLEVVENQLRDGDPACTREALARLEELPQCVSVCYYK